MKTEKTIAKFLRLILPDQDGHVFPFAKRDPSGSVVVTEAHCREQLERYRDYVPLKDFDHVAKRIPSLCGRYDTLTPDTVAWQQVAWCFAELAA